MISDVEPALRRIIQNLRGGRFDDARDSTVDLIESASRMSGPMYREPVGKPGCQPDAQQYIRAAEKLRALTKDLRDVCYTLRRGIPTDALQMAEHALLAYLRSETAARTRH